MVKIEINGQSIRAREGSMLIDVADDAGISIPRFCYHKKLSVAANCRMCLVEVTGAPKSLPACATPVTDGMKVFTKSPKALAAQKAVMEFLLINHPLDCPICDQGGECELQDVSMLYGDDISRFSEGKRILGDKNIGPLVQTDMTRCIHCTRCVRFGKEVAGIMELGATGRGEHMEIGTYVAKAMVSEMAGNIIDLCPVGALTSKPYRYTARAWELKATPAIAIHDGVGSNIYLHHKQGEVKRVVPQENEAINEVWLSDRDRFSYTGLQHNRLTQPMRKVDGEWVAVTWEAALNEVSALLKGQLEADANSVGALISPTASVEELHLLQKLLRAKGCHNIDHRLGQQDFSLDATGVMPYLSIPIADIEQAKAILIVGSNLRHEQPLLNHRVRKASMSRGKVMAINPVDIDFNYRLNSKSIVPAHEMTASIARLAVALKGDRELTAAQSALLTGVITDETAQKMASLLSVDGKKVVFLGQLAQSNAAFGRLLQLATLVAELSGAVFSWLPSAGNSLGAALVGAHPTSKGLNSSQMLTQGMKNWVFWGVEPAIDCLLPQGQTVSGRVVAFSAFDTEVLRQQADWMLPIAGFGESAGSYVNANGVWQYSQVALNLKGEAKPGWKVLRVLGNMLDAAGFEFTSLDQVTHEAKASAKSPSIVALDVVLSVTTPASPASNGLSRIASMPMYATDMLVRHAVPLQEHSHAKIAQIRLNSADAQKLGIKSDQVSLVGVSGNAVIYPCVIDDSIAEGSVVAPMVLLADLPLNDMFISAVEGV